MHEIGHHFELEHSNDNDPHDIMWAPGTNEDEDKIKGVPMIFKPEHIKQLREFPGYEGHNRL